MVLSLNVLEYFVKFTFEPINKLNWSDNFILDDNWQVLKLNNHRIITKTYKNKIPYNDIRIEYDIALYNKTRWYCLDTTNNIGTVIRMSKEDINIPNLKILSVDYKPYVCYVKFNFDKDILLTMLLQNDEYESIERNNVYNKYLFIDNLKIEIFNSILRYKGVNYKEFYNMFKNIDSEYKIFEKDMLKIYKMINIEPEYISHESVGVLTWYKAKRENQNKWPDISLELKPNSIEFPKNSGIYYYSKDNYISLAKRNDDNPELYIPKISKTNHLKNESSILYKYINSIPIENNISIPDIVRKKYNINNITKIKKIRKNQKYINLSFDGGIVYGDIKPKYLVYDNIIVKEIDNPNICNINIIPDAQILDKDNNRVCIIVDNEIIPSYGYRIRNVITLPWYYKQIIHDYNMLGRLKNGPIMDLMHIGIVDKESNDIITFPYNKELYISTCLQTHRLTTFKFYINVNIKYS
nr:putative maintenance function [Saccharomycopsis selenospora]